MKNTLSSWETYARSLMRIILAYVFMLHGFRHLFGYFAVSGGRRALIPMAIDGLPAMFGYLEIGGGLLLLLGLFTRPVAAVLSLELIAAYIVSAAPRGPWPIRNGGNEVLLYLIVFLYLVVTGGGAWSLDRLFSKPNIDEAGYRPAGAAART